MGSGVYPAAENIRSVQCRFELVYTWDSHKFRQATDTHEDTLGIFLRPTRNAYFELLCPAWASETFEFYAHSLSGFIGWGVPSMTSAKNTS